MFEPRRLFLQLGSVFAILPAQRVGAFCCGAMMLATESSAQAGARRLVEDHLQKRLSLRADELKVMQLSARDMPVGTQEFYAEVRGGRHNGINCLVQADKVYCSGTPDEFQRFLKDYRYFEKSDLSAAQLMRLFALLALPRQLKTIDAAALASGAMQYRAFPDVAAPKLVDSDSGLVLSFWATPALEVDPKPWVVKVSRDYAVEVQQQKAAASR
jgi:hypothetical protein